MDPSSWVNYTAQHYSRLRASGNQMNQLNVPTGLNVGQSGHQLNVNDHLGIGVAANATNQAMSGHYGSSAAHPHSWLFSSHGLNAATHQTPTHESSSFNATPFLHHPGYDSSFLSAPFQAKATYLPSAATSFFNPMKKTDNELRNAAYCSTMNMSGMSANNINNITNDPNASLATGSLFPSHLTPTSWRHHPNLMATNTSSGPFGILPHEAVNAVNVMNSASNSVGNSHSHPSHASHSSHSSHSSHNSSSHHSNSSHNKSSNESTKGHHFHHHHKTSSAMSGMSSVDNSFRNIMPSLPPTQSSHAISSRGQTSFDTSVGAKITSHHHHSQSDPYASGMFAMAAAAHAINSDYASMQQQRYATGMGTGNQHTFASNATSRTAYPSVGFHSDPSARSRELLNSSSLLHSSKQGSSNSCNARNMSAMNAMNASSYLSNCGMMSMMNASAGSVANYSPSPAHTVNNVIPNNLAVNTSASRSSSSASNHGLQQGNDSSCSFGYGSPATNLPQSPYPQPQRSNTSNSSQGTPTATGSAIQSSAQDYSNYGTPQGFPSMGTQTPTPTPGYPTPPSSVGQPHVTPSNSQPSAQHEEQQVSHYPQLTPQTPTQNTQFSANYNTNFASNAKLTTNTSRASESILPNTSSSCMVAAAAVANMNNSQNSSTIVSQRPPSGYLISGANIAEPESECLSNMVSVNPMSDNSISNAKLNDTQLNSSNDVIGHQTEPTLNSVFSSQEIDFPIINFSVSDETPNPFNNNLKLEQNSFNKKKNKSGKKNKKKDKNKVGVGIGVDPNNAFSAYHYPTQQQYQNTYPSMPREHTNAYLMPQTIGHHNQTQQQTQQTHVIPNDSTDTHSNNSCYDMQYQHIQQQHQQQQQQPQQQLQQQTAQHPQQQQQAEHDLMQQLPHETLQQTADHQMIEPVMSMASQHMTQTQTNSVAEKQSFPTIDDELSFLTEPTDCVSMETQTNNTSVPLETQSPLVINQTSNICSERSNLSPNSNSNQGTNSSQASGFLKSFMSFIHDGTRVSPSGTPVVTKEKKKKKLKESNENKVKQNNTINGQKLCKYNKKIKLEDSFGLDNEEVCDFEHRKKSNFSPINQNTPKLMSGENMSNKKTTGDRENYESKFFKRRPSTNINTNNVHIIEMDSRKDIKTTKKKKQNKNDLNSLSNDLQTFHDEYEFPDSPPLTNTQSVKKRKSSSSDNSSKKRSAPNFEKITSPSININFKKNNNKKNVSQVLSNSTQMTSTTKPFLTTSKMNSIESSINSVAMNITATIDSQTVQSEQAPKPNQIVPTPKPPAVNPNSNAPNNKKTNCTSNQTNNKKQTQNQTNNKKSSNVKTNTTTTTTTTTSTTGNFSFDQILSPIQTTEISNNTNSTTCATATTNTITNSTATANSNSNQQSVGMQSAGTNTPRRRSQDKKASTIREGLMRTGDFVVSIEDSQIELPVIWRIEGKSLLQRFEPSEQDDITVYINTSSYSAWNPTVRQRYTGVDVRIMGCSRTRIVVEKLGLTQTNPNTMNGSTTIERINPSNKCATSTSSNSYHHQENFEVFIQTLISQALDPNFISEIVKENDEYFLSHVQAIDDVCSRKKSRFFSKVKWDANIVKCVETYPLFTVTPQNNVGDLRCRLCHDNWSTQILQFNGEPYNQMTLEPQTAIDMKQTKYAACDPCTDKIVLYSHLHHQKYNFFCKCKSKVENMRGGDDSKESHVILELCLQDSDWINMLFKELEEIWISCDKIR